MVAVAPSRLTHGHGTPIDVSQSANTLVVSGGLSDSEGFVSQIFVEDDEDGDPFASPTLPNVGPVILWQIPGFNISGLNDQSNLSIEPLIRPVKGSSPLEQRTLWYWNPQSECVEPAASDFHLLGTGMRFTTLTPADTAPPPAFLLTASLAGQQNFHNHGLLSYAVDNSPPPAVGAYGFFARLTSNEYTTSNPFLIVINQGVEYEQMVTAALAINAAAADFEGDFNLDGAVDAADYVTWRKSIVTPPEYETWRANFGATVECCTCESNSIPAPEPTTYSLVLSCFAWMIAMFTGRSRCGR
jgi:hypothetical protein